MKKIIAMELCLALALSLFGCAAKPTEILKEPPVLTIVCGDKNVEALKGTTSWTYQNEDGTSTGFEADCRREKVHGINRPYTSKRSNRFGCNHRGRT